MRSIPLPQMRPLEAENIGTIKNCAKLLAGTPEQQESRKAIPAVLTMARKLDDEPFKETIAEVFVSSTVDSLPGQLISRSFAMGGEDGKDAPHTNPFLIRLGIMGEEAHALILESERIVGVKVLSAQLRYRIGSTPISPGIRKLDFLGKA